MPITWTAEKYQKLLSAVIAAHPQFKLNYREIAVYFGESATYDAIEGCFRPIKKRAAQLREEVQSGKRPSVPPAPKKKTKRTHEDTEDTVRTEEYGTAPPITPPPSAKKVKAVSETPKVRPAFTSSNHPALVPSTTPKKPISISSAHNTPKKPISTHSTHNTPKKNITPIKLPSQTPLQRGSGMLQLQQQKSARQIETVDLCSDGEEDTSIVSPYASQASITKSMPPSAAADIKTSFHNQQDDDPGTVSDEY
jgi:hypothetical protein